MRESGLGDNMRVKYYSKCLNPNGDLVETNKCDGLKVGQTVEFEVDLELLSCPSDPTKWRQSFTIYPIGVGENLTITVDMLCDCDCNNSSHSVMKDRHFSYFQIIFYLTFHILAKLFGIFLGKR